MERLSNNAIFSVFDTNDIKFIEDFTKKMINKKKPEHPEKFYKEKFIENARKYINGEFNNESSKQFLNKYINNILSKNLNPIESIIQISHLYKSLSYYPDIDVILNLIKTNNKLYECLESLYKKEEKEIKNGKINDIFNDDILIQFLEVFLDISGVYYYNDTFDYNEESKDLDLTRMCILEISQFPVLSKEEELNLSIKISKGDMEARKKLIEHNLRLVVNIAKPYASSAQQLTDTIQDGALGLIKAADKYDYKKGYRFSTYATWWIRQSINREKIETGQHIRIPNYTYERRQNLMKIYWNLEKELGREPSVEELSLKSHLSKVYIEDLLSLPSNIDSLNKKIVIDDETVSEVQDFIPDNSTFFEDYIEEVTLKEEVQIWLNESKIKDKHKEMLRIRFGLDGKGPRTLEQTANEMGYSREHVRQSIIRAIGKLRNERKQIQKFAVYMDDPDNAIRYIDDYIAIKKKKKKA